MHSKSLTAILIAALAGGCVPPPPKLIVSHSDPSVKIPAIKKAVRQEDRSALAQLVKDLESDDPAVRFYAVEGLRRITGEDRGYQYWRQPADQRPALQRWQAWLAQQETADGERP